MELLYTSCIPHGEIHAVAWSGMNLVAISVSIHTQGVITEAYRRLKCSLAVCGGGDLIL